MTCCWLNNFLLDLMEWSNVHVGHGVPVGDDRVWLSGLLLQEPAQDSNDIDRICPSSLLSTAASRSSIFKCFVRMVQLRGEIGLIVTVTHSNYIIRIKRFTRLTPKMFPSIRIEEC